jgi:hypothetical protein
VELSLRYRPLFIILALIASTKPSTVSLSRLFLYTSAVLRSACLEFVHLVYLLCKRLFPSQRTCQTITITNLLNDPPQTKLAKFDILSRYLILPNRKLYKNTSSVPLHGHVTFLSFDPQHNSPPRLKFTS